MAGSLPVGARPLPPRRFGGPEGAAAVRLHEHTLLRLEDPERGSDQYGVYRWMEEEMDISEALMTRLSRMLLERIPAQPISEARRKTRQRGWRRREGQDLCPDCAGA